MKRSSKRSPKRQKKDTPRHNMAFTIEAIDGMGQGVSKAGGTTCFIAKTLPGETGTAQVFKRSKGVAFASAESIQLTAPNRVTPECEHFADCPGCHFLHTDYDSELAYKQAALRRMLRDLPFDEQQLTLHRAPQRLAYRNRVQLHYRHRYIGMLDGASDRVVEVPHCKIIASELQPALDALYRDKSWSDTRPGSGHCEIYSKDGEVQAHWNEPYAQGGFTQVNDAMNQALRTTLQGYAAQGAATTLLDLFAGQGNLSAHLPGNSGRRVMVDYVPGQLATAEQHENFYNLDLFDPESLVSLRRRMTDETFELLIVDPPRKGFPALAQWVQSYKPVQLIYVSCNAATMVRDLKTLQGKYTITDICLLDLFPSTYHYETMVRVEFKHHRKIKSS